jgi:DNA-directed RNA polymerase specialized sigma24 family protein
MNHATRLRKVTSAYEDGVLRLRRARDEAVLAAHDDGLSYREIAEVCEMHIENVRRIVREQRLASRS